MGHLSRGRRRSRAFVLLEVIVAMAILGVAVAAFMRSFTQSLHAAKQMEIHTQAQFFARQLLDEFEIFPPEEGETEGGFGEDYPFYFYRVDVRYVEPDYNRRVLEVPDDVEQLFAMREITLEIFYQDARMTDPVRPVHLETAIMGLEKFSFESKRSYANF